MYVGLKQPRGDGERCVTPARAPAKETRSGFGRDTFVFDQGHVTKNQPITLLALLSESLGIEKISIQGYRLHTVEIIFLSDLPLALG